MAFDFKKEYKEFYMPKDKPGIVTIPKMNYIAVRGKGDPNQEDSEYKQSIGLLYGIAFTIKMSKKGDHRIDGYFDYVVPPLEGFWWQDGVKGIDYAHCEKDRSTEIEDSGQAPDKIYMVCQSKVIPGLFRASRFHNPPRYSHFRGAARHFMLISGRVIKSFSHFRASTKWEMTFDPGIIYRGGVLCILLTRKEY